MRRLGAGQRAAYRARQRHQRRPPHRRPADPLGWHGSRRRSAPGSSGWRRPVAVRAPATRRPAAPPARAASSATATVPAAVLATGAPGVSRSFRAGGDPIHPHELAEDAAAQRVIQARNPAGNRVPREASAAETSASVLRINCPGPRSMSSSRTAAPPAQTVASRSHGRAESTVLASAACPRRCAQSRYSPNTQSSPCAARAGCQVGCGSALARRVPLRGGRNARPVSSGPSGPTRGQGGAPAAAGRPPGRPGRRRRRRGGTTLTPAFVGPGGIPAG